MTDLPDKMPPRLLPPTTRVPKVFSVWGTVCYGIAAVFSVTQVILIAVARLTPPWYVTSIAFLYVFTSTGLICTGRIESNRDARFFMRALKKRSDENKRRMN